MEALKGVLALQGSSHGGEVMSSLTYFIKILALVVDYNIILFCLGKYIYILNIYYIYVICIIIFYVCINIDLQFLIMIDHVMFCHHDILILSTNVHNIFCLTCNLFLFGNCTVSCPYRLPTLDRDLEQQRKRWIRRTTIKK